MKRRAPGAPRPDAAGIVLVLISACLVMIVSLAVLFLRAGSLLASQTAALSARSQADLAAASAMEYAAARLLAEGAPRHSAAPDDRGDDWTFRDPLGIQSSLGTSLNPSWSHGEHWGDPENADSLDNDGDGSTDEGDEGNGAYDEGLDDVSAASWTDRDGDGRFSAWTGRLRGSAGPSLRFSLRVESPGGKIPLNAGFLDAGDRNQTHADVLDNDGDGAVDEADEKRPDHQDPFFLYHKGLIHALNNLGAMKLPPGHSRLWGPIATSGESILYSVLGDDLICNRPLGGYRDADHVKKVLAPLGYDNADLDRILPFLDLSVPVCGWEAGPPYSGRQQDKTTRTPFSPVELAIAPREVLEAVWRYLVIGEYAGQMGDMCRMEWYWEPAAMGFQNPRQMKLYRWPYRHVIFPDEAGRFADHAIAYRRGAGPSLSWDGLYKAFLENAESFDDDVYNPSSTDGKIVRSAIDLGTAPFAHRRYAQVLADLAFAAVCPDPWPFNHNQPLAGSGWEIDRDSAVPGVQPERALADWSRLARIPLPPIPYPPPVPFTFPDAYVISHTPFIAYNLFPDRIAPLGFTTAPPSRFSIEGLGEVLQGGGAPLASARVEGSLRPSERLFFTSQEDFENCEGGPYLRRIGVIPVNDPWDGDSSPAPLSSRRGLRKDDMGTPLVPFDDRIYAHVASLPFWPIRSLPSAWVSNESYYSRWFGSLVLAAREGGRQGANLYWAFGETDLGISCADGLGDTPGGFPSEPFFSSIPWNLDPLAGRSVYPYGGGIHRWFFFNPLQCSGASPDFLPPLVLQEPESFPTGLPGLDDGMPVAGLTIEGWLSTPDYSASPDRLKITPSGGGNAYLKLRSTRQIRTEDPYTDITFTCEKSWPSGDGTPLLEDISLGPIVVRDLDHPSPSIHFAIVIRRTAPDETELTLRVDGGGMPGVNELTETVPVLLGTDDETLEITAVDELRLYGSARVQSETETRYRLGRFVRAGTYRSPLYGLDCAARLLQCQWTGITPASYAPVQPFKVRVIGYEKADGTGADWTSPDMIESGLVCGLDSIPPGIRSFRYEVELDATAVDTTPPKPPLVDTPRFESIWFTLRRAGRTPAWVSWQAR